MFRIKICGITNVADASAAADAGADAIGLNFYQRSARYVDFDRADAIVKALAPDVFRVGVFVNEDVEEIHSLLADLGAKGTSRLHAVQLHGDEGPHVLAQLRVPYLIRARRITDRGVAEIAADLEACEIFHRIPDAVLVDAAAPGQYGGTGTTISWIGMTDYPRWLRNVPLILAGGLTPDNVAEAIRIVRPAAVDVASGVESSPGKKDPHKVRDFVAAAKAAFESLES